MHDLQLPKDLFTSRLGCSDVNDLSTIGASTHANIHRVLSCRLTFLAMMALVGPCRHRLTVPPFPHPSSLSTSKSSLRRSSLNSTPSSRVASCSESLLWYDERVEAVDDDEREGVEGSNGGDEDGGVLFEE